MSPYSASGINSLPSAHSVDETAARLRAILDAKGIALFALIDHSGEAKKVGMKMPPIKLLIFGNPAAGTPLMLASPTVAIDLPLKIIIAEDAAGQVHISWNDPVWIQQRHGFSTELLKNIAVVETLAAKAAGAPSEQ
jgi:uncharacterized protein (DUF302 family)